MTQKEIDKRRGFLKDRIDILDDCISKLEITANNFYSPQGKELKAWNILLGSRDKITKIRDKDQLELDNLK